LLICILGFAAFIGWVTIIRMKNEIIMRDLHRPWVAQRFGGAEIGVANANATANATANANANVEGKQS
jgi:heme exporter protein C